MNNVPQALEWVRELAACSTKAVFSDLYRGAEEDAKQATEARADGVVFSAKSNTDGNMFTVYQVESLNRQVKFCSSPNFIKIKGAADDDLTVTLTLNNEGRCKLRVARGKEIVGEELEQWQVRRLALERLFFGPFDLDV